MLVLAGASLSACSNKTSNSRVVPEQEITQDINAARGRNSTTLPAGADLTQQTLGREPSVPAGPELPPIPPSRPAEARRSQFRAIRRRVMTSRSAPALRAISYRRTKNHQSACRRPGFPDDRERLPGLTVVPRSPTSARFTSTNRELGWLYSMTRTRLSPQPSHGSAHSRRLPSYGERWPRQWAAIASPTPPRSLPVAPGWTAAFLELV
jgi:hypothetical protein